ncbi:MAG: ribonuclease HIII [Eubacteriaceae bacterium]|nr:ribonuclease HIII [Eubacteriaceae bacterium]
MENINDIKELLLREGYVPTEEKAIPYGVQLKLGDAGNIRLYTNKKGKSTLDLSQLKDERLKMLLSAPKEGFPLLSPPLCGSDEAGKGDWFGPLVVSCVYCDELMYSALASAGVRDSKKLSDGRIDELRDTIIRICPVYTVVELSAGSFNRLYSSCPNMNTILEAAHARAAVKTARRSGCSRVLIDQFTTPQKMEKALSGSGIELTLAHRAEENLAVAAASILARSVYRKRLTEMGEKYGIEFCAGAGNAADEAAERFAAAYGTDALEEVCKINFRNTGRIATDGSR